MPLSRLERRSDLRDTLARGLASMAIASDLADPASTGAAWHREHPLSGITRLAAYALCRDSEGRLLMCRVSARDQLDAGRWTLPGGGLEFGEDPQTGALRELYEETGLRGQILGLSFIDSVVYPPNAKRAEPMHALRLVFAVHIVGGELRDEPDGSTDHAAWLTPDEARRLPLVDLGERALELIAAS